MFATVSDYSLFYYSVLTLCLIGKFAFGKRLNSNLDTIFAILICLLFGGVFGSRPVDVGSDTFAYYTWFNDIKGDSIENVANLTFGKDPVIRLIFWLFSNISTIGVTLGFVSFIFTYLCYYFSKKICEVAHLGNGFILFLLTMYSFTAFNCEINIIRAGLGIGFWLIFTIYLFKKNTKSSILYGLLALFTHFSTIVFIIIAIIAYGLKLSINKYMFMVVAILILSFIGLSILRFVDFNIFNFEKASNYINNIDKTSYKIGFRFSFAAFNLLFLFIPFFLKRYLGELEKYYFRLYALSTMIFFLWFSIPFSDRIGAFSWFLIPTIIYFPLVRRYGSNSKIVILSCIVYGIINYSI